MSPTSMAVPVQQIGSSVSEFSLPVIGIGEQRTLAHFLAGKQGVVVVFWSSVCSHCARYDQYFNAFTTRHPQIGFLAIASRQGESAEMIQGAATERKLTFPIVHDAGGVVSSAWYTQHTPRAFLVDVECKLLYRGAIDNFKLPGDRQFVSYLEPAIDQFLAGKPIARAEAASFGCAIQSVYYILPKAL